jgi:hypothetical protein
MILKSLDENKMQKMSFIKNTHLVQTGRFNILVKTRVFWGRFEVGTLHREKVRTTKITTSKTKKNIKKFGDDHYIKMCPLADHYYDITTTTKKRLLTL